MPRFRVMLRGDGFRNLIEGQEKPIGFFTTRYVDAVSELEARERAVAVLKSERKFRCVSRSLSSENVVVEKIAQVSFWTHRFPRRLGFTFFIWEQQETSNDT